MSEQALLVSPGPTPAAPPAPEELPSPSGAAPAVELEQESPAIAAATWAAFCQTNRRRRAIRDFDGAPLEDAVIRELLAEAQLAPTSGNLQPYQLHWLRDPAKKARVAEACEAQRAASSASTLIVVVTSRRLAVRTAEAQLHHVEASGLNDKSKTYYRAQLRKFRRFLGIAPLLAPLRLVLSLLHPARTLLPLGVSGVRHWTARSGLYAAQTLILAASARGLDTCPMEGFDAAKVAGLLDLPRGSVIPIVIALGRRRSDARVEPRWRRPLAEAVIEHG